MKNLLFILNPMAGKGLIVNKIYSVLAFYTEKGYIVTALPTGRREVLEEVFNNQIGNFQLIVCAGGDGTLNGVISICMETGCRLPIAYLPVGSTNDFAKTLGYSNDFNENLENSCVDVYHKIDIGKFGNKYFVYVAAFGSLAEVSYSTSQSSKNLLGHLAYLLKGIQKITDLKAYTLKMEYEDGCIEGTFVLGLIMNSLSIGGFKNPVSDAVILNDGLFEVLLIKKPSNLSELQTIIIDLISQKVDGEMFYYIQTSHLVIRSEPMGWSLDGEFGGVVEAAEVWNCREAIEIKGS